ncbi:valine--tRNA ligase, mitochondrial 1 [Colias croceus]|uniref:valine--tRNA ligase, mitochondrial 1 n=1 Tax=Colias crocea TaxID=72248 RepID=UPI001E27B293|nr:valine--tRNA ligase, mitochondrial 1 [Colias croceus]
MIWKYYLGSCSCQRRFISSTTKIILKENLPSTAYKPEIVEKDKYNKWTQEKLFEGKLNDEKPVFSMVLPPPNVTGKLHLGHALSSTIQDVIARRQRSLGYNVMWLPGTDHAGIATQRVVEKYLSSNQNIDRHTIGREKFTHEVWKWKEKHGNAICDQLKMLGYSLDWSREVFTMDENLSHAVTTAFLNLFQKGLIYRKKGLVNWCTTLKSTVSDIEVDNVAVTEVTDLKLPTYAKPVKFGQIYNFAYKVYDSDQEVVVSTTIPESMLGDSAVAVHPEDNRYKHLKGKNLVHPFRETLIPIIFDDFVDMNFGTGAVKITPAHSKIDYDIAKRHNLPLLQVINEDGVMENSGKFNSMRKYDCREVLIKELDDLGLLRAINPHQMTLPICSRTGDVIEYLPKEQWFLSCTLLNERAAQVVEEGHLKIDPEKYKSQWEHWTNDCRDWCISRQLWWGHQIPAYKCSVGKEFVWIAATNETTAKVEASKFLRTVPDDITVNRDSDVLDTWFSSGIYPFAALGWPEHQKSQDYKKFYPLNLMVTGNDILGFWVHRMVMLGLELTDKLPFNNVLLHGVICDSKGAKMSKSRGNVIDPIDVINGISLDKLKDKAVQMHKDGAITKEELKRALSYHKSNFYNTKGIPECGVDALRFTLLSQDVKSNFITFDVHQCFANKLFCNKIWQSIKYMQLSFAKLKEIDEEITHDDLTYFDKWILSRLSEMVEKVNSSMDTNEFHTATKALRTFIYNEFCDVYLEATKPGFDNGNPKTGYGHAHTLSAVLNCSLRSLSPFMIYLTHEIIPKIPAFETNIIHNYNDLDKDYFDFPQTADYKSWKNEELEKQVENLLDTISIVRELRGFYGISNKERPTIVIRSKNNKLMDDIMHNLKIVLNLTKCSDVKFDKDSEKKYISSILDTKTEVFVEIPGNDADSLIEAAKSKLEKRIKKMKENVEKYEEQLSSYNYITSVPECSQLQDFEKLKSQKQELKRLERLI